MHAHNAIMVITHKQQQTTLVLEQFDRTMDPLPHESEGWHLMICKHANRREGMRYQGQVGRDSIKELICVHSSAEGGLVDRMCREVPMRHDKLNKLLPGTMVTHFQHCISE